MRGSARLTRDALHDILEKINMRHGNEALFDEVKEFFHMYMRGMKKNYWQIYIQYEYKAKNQNQLKTNMTLGFEELYEFFTYFGRERKSKFNNPDVSWRERLMPGTRREKLDEVIDSLKELRMCLEDNRGILSEYFEKLATKYDMLLEEITPL
jgi:hypothetical protein